MRWKSALNGRAVQCSDFRPIISGFDILKVSSLLKNPAEFFVDFKTFLDEKGVEITPATIIQLAETDIRVDSVTEGGV